MTQRLMQVTVPGARAAEAAGCLDAGRLVGRFTEAAGGAGRERFEVLIGSGEAEAVMDRLEARFSGEAAFQVVLVPVEAALPRPGDDEATPAGAPRPRGVLLRVGREELWAEISRGSRVTPTYCAMVTLSVLVAAVALLRDDVAVLVGAMVIAPLLGPNMALALATALGDGALARRALAANLVGVAIAVTLSLAAGFALPFDPAGEAIVARTRIGLDDVILALAAGCAGTLAYTSGLPGTLIGVMVAVALVPPLVTAGLLAGAGRPGPAAGALALTFCNVICVNLAGVVTFLLQGVGPRSWWAAERAKKSALRAALVWLGLLAALLAVLAAAGAGGGAAVVPEPV